ncbi:MAG: DUF7714 family protein [Candidatus Freyarchaeota archaeon]|nr:hypothetical protein [Candidatus Freyrarchaeum guaymaensis]
MPRVVHPQKVNLIKGVVDEGDLIGRRVFHVTEYVVAGGSDGWRVFQVETGKGALLREVTGARMLSNEDETVFVEVNVDPTSKRDVLASISGKVDGAIRSVVYKAKYGHVGLALFEPPDTHVHIVEVEPPSPKLIDYVEVSRREGLLRRDTRFSCSVVNVLELIDRENRLILPCRIMEVKGGVTLDEDVANIERAKGSFTLLGCPVTLATVKELNPRLKVKLVDMCPVHLARRIKSDADFYMVRCCRASIHGTLSYHAGRRKVIALQWSPSLEEFLDAIYHGST